MKLKHKIKLDVMLFFQTGKIDCLELGKTKEWILNNFPDPDDYGIGENLDSAKIWRYGNIELHFDRNELIMIYSDYIDELDSGNSIEIDRWILGRAERPLFSRIINEFNMLMLDYSVRNRRNLNQVQIELSESKVKLGFEGDEYKIQQDNEYSINDYELCFFCLTHKPNLL